MKIEITNKLSNITAVLDQIEEYLASNEVSLGDIFKFNLSIDEFIANIINYAYSDELEHKITIEVNVINNEITAVLTDDGVEFDPLKAEEPDTNLSIEDRQIGGLGIHLARNFMDEIKYQRISNTNRLYLSKKINNKEDKND